MKREGGGVENQAFPEDWVTSHKMVPFELYGVRDERLEGDCHGSRREIFRVFGFFCT